MQQASFQREVWNAEPAEPAEKAEFRSLRPLRPLRSIPELKIGAGAHLAILTTGYPVGELRLISANASASIGSSTVKGAPLPGCGRTSIVPPWFSMIRCEMGRPRPVPFSLVV